MCAAGLSGRRAFWSRRSAVPENMKDGGGLRRVVFLWSSFQTINTTQRRKITSSLQREYKLEPQVVWVRAPVPAAAELQRWMTMTFELLRYKMSSLLLVLWNSLVSQVTHRLCARIMRTTVFCWMMCRPRNNFIKRCYCHFNITDIIFMHSHPLKEYIVRWATIQQYRCKVIKHRFISLPLFWNSHVLTVSLRPSPIVSSLTGSWFCYRELTVFHLNVRNYWRALK